MDDYTCVTDCPTHYYPNRTGNYSCMQCDTICENCSGIATNCTSCNITYYLYQNTCHQPCPYETYADDPSQRCFPCNNLCSVCAITPNNCSVCDTTGPHTSYLKDGTTCVKECGVLYFENNNAGLGPNLCTRCDIRCEQCDISPSNCS